MHTVYIHIERKKENKKLWKLLEFNFIKKKWQQPAKNRLYEYQFILQKGQIGKHIQFNYTVTESTIQTEKLKFSGFDLIIISNLLLSII